MKYIKLAIIKPFSGNHRHTIALAYKQLVRSHNRQAVLKDAEVSLSLERGVTFG